MIVPVEYMSSFSSLLNQYRSIIEQELNFNIKAGKIKIEDSSLIMVRSQNADEIKFSGTIKLVIQPNDKEELLLKENKELKEKLYKIQEALDIYD
jgi:hypothetical protein